MGDNSNVRERGAGRGGGVCRIMVALFSGNVSGVQVGDTGAPLIVIFPIVCAKRGGSPDSFIWHLCVGVRDGWGGKGVSGSEGKSVVCLKFVSGQFAHLRGWWAAPDGSMRFATEANVGRSGTVRAPCERYARHLRRVGGGEGWEVRTDEGGQEGDVWAFPSGRPLLPLRISFFVVRVVRSSFGIG